MNKPIDDLISKDRSQNTSSINLSQQKTEAIRHNDTMKVAYSQLKTEQDLLNALNELKSEQDTSSQKSNKHFNITLGISIASLFAAVAAAIIPLILHFL